MQHPDFSTLAAAMFDTEGKVDLDAADRLWAAVFGLPLWHILMSPQSAVDNQPAAQLIEEKVWLLAFTDKAKLANYAARNKNLDRQGNALSLDLAPAQCVELGRTLQHSNVFGFRFNEAQQHGWYIPMTDFLRIPDYLAEKGLI
ncbi:MAG: hypothetical protein OHK0011_09710 [Turneriella sp.]